MSNAFSFITSNVVVGESSVPGYAFKTRTAGVLELDQVGTKARVEVDGNVEAAGLRLIKVGAERVFVSGANGDLTVSSYPGEAVGNATFMLSGLLDPARVVGDYSFGNIVVNGTFTASEVGGNVSASNVVSGVLDDARLDGSYSFGSLGVTGNVTSAHASGNLSTTRVVSGTLPPGRLSGAYTFDSLALTGNVDAAHVNASVSANTVVSGVLPNDRLVGKYTVANTTSSLLVSNAMRVSGQPTGRCLVSNGSNVVSSATTAADMAFVRGMTGGIQVQLDTIHDGLVVGNAIEHLDATQIKLGTLDPSRLSGSYAFESLALTGNLVASTIAANVPASNIESGIIDASHLVGNYLHLTELVASNTIDAATVSAGLHADDLVVGHLSDARMVGAYVADTLTASTVDAAWVHGNLHTSNLTSGVVPAGRFDFDPVESNIVSVGRNLGTASIPWRNASWNSSTIDDLVVGSAIRRGSATMQLNLQSTRANILPASNLYSVGTVSSPWSNVYAAGVSIGNTLIVSGGIVDETGNSLSFDLENVPVSMLPKTSGLWFGTDEKPWGTVRASKLDVGSFSGGVISTDLESRSATHIGTNASSWSTVFTQNATGALDGNGVGDIWSQLDVVTGTIEVMDGISLPSEVGAFRFLADETTGLGLRDGTTPGGVDMTVGNTTATIVESGVVTRNGHVDPVSNGTRTIGSSGATWRDVYAANVYTSAGRVGMGSTVTSGRVDVDGNVVVSECTASGVVSASSLSGLISTSNLTGTVDESRFGDETYTVTNLDVGGDLAIDGSLACGHLVPAGDAVYDLGSASNRFRDLHVSNGSIRLGTATVSEVDGYVTVSSNVVVTNGISGAFNKPVVSNVQITDGAWTVLDDTAVGVTGGHVVVNGNGFAPGSLCVIGGTNAPTTSYVSTAQLRVQVPAKSVGTYDVTIVRPDSKSATLPAGLTYSDAVTWITSSQLGNVEYGQSFSIPLVATSDSTVTYANLTSIPADTTLDPITGNLTGNITSITSSTLFAFDVRATDQELQDATRSFLLQLDNVH